MRTAAALILLPLASLAVVLYALADGVAGCAG